MADLFRVLSELEPPGPDFTPEPLLDQRFDMRRLFELHSSLRDQSIFPNSIPIQGEIDTRYWFLQLAEKFLIQAKQASAMAESYRQFNVGAMMFTEREPGEIGVYYGANRKPRPDAPKICAERVALEKAVTMGDKHVIGIAVYGPTQPDHGSGIHHEILEPCEACRAMFHESSLTNGDTLFAGANPSGDYEITDIATIWANHGDGIRDSQINTYRVIPSAVQALVQLTLSGHLPGNAVFDADD